MPELIAWFVALLLIGMAVGVTLALIGIRRIRKDLDAKQRSDAAVEEEVHRWLAAKTGEPPDSPPNPPRHLRLMPAWAGIAVGFGAATEWARAHVAQVATGAASTVTVATLVVAGEHSSNEAMSDPPPSLVPPLTSERSPSSTSELPSPGPRSTTTRSGGGTPTTTTTTVLLPPTTAVLTTTAAAPASTTGMPTPTITPPTLPTCVAQVELGKLVEVCAPPLLR